MTRPSAISSPQQAICALAAGESSIVSGARCGAATWTAQSTRPGGAAEELSADDLRPYRALWLYFAASWAAERARTSGRVEDAQFARELKRDVEQCARTLPFVPRVTVDDAAPAPGAEYDLRADRAAQALQRLHLRGRRFEQRIADFLERINNDAATQFELGLQTLGELLGFESMRPNEQADPDGIWRDDDRQWLLFEAKTEVQPERAVSADEIRR